ncbi:hypothetical protein AB0C61_33125 [Streptomyces sp. NPDC048680]|uniref:hypothetical protein n=1 Tax=Streptomyces sp. NPDC048680 TaxID=3155492 RepID=UPI00343F96E0
MTLQQPAAAPKALPLYEASGYRTALIAFRAFRDLYRAGYIAYATARLGTHELAERVVEDSFTALAVHWSATLGCAHPAALAWRLLAACVDDADGTPLPCPGGRSCSSAAHVLRDHLRMDIGRASDLMGLTRGEFLVALCSAACPVISCCGAQQSCAAA